MKKDMGKNMRKNKKTVLGLVSAGLILCITLFFIYNRFLSETGKWAENVPVLMYHHLLRDEENTFGDNGAILSVETFEEHMDILHKNGYNTVSLDQLEKFIKGEIKLPKRSVVITFDDGYKSNYKYAYPILKKYGFNGVIFLISGWSTDDTVPFDANEIQHLSWGEIESSRDVFEYASHTHDLHKLGENEQGYLVTGPLDEIKSDLETSMQVLDTVYFAYPYGHYNEETLEILKDLGYRMAFTIEPGSVSPGDSLLELNRYPIFPYTSLKEFKDIIGL